MEKDYIKEAREGIAEVLKVARRLDEKNLVNAFEGNISCKVDGKIYITPTGKNKGLLTEDMVAVIDEKGNWIGGSCKPTSELPMHYNTYLMRDDIGGVVHAHPPYLTAHALCNLPVECRAYPELMGNFNRFEVAAYGRPGTDDIYKDVRRIIERSDIIILANHGVLCVGKTVTEAMNKLEAAEAITRIVDMANRLGKPVDLPESECDFFFSLNNRKP